MRNTMVAVFLVVGALTISSAALAHHSQSVYEAGETVLTGTVTKFRLINPHSQIHFQVKDANGNVTDWMAQGGSPSGMRRDGWTAKTVQPGDQVIISGNVARNGRKEMHIVKLEVNGKLIRNTELNNVSPRNPAQ